MMKQWKRYGMVVLWALVALFALTAAVPAFADDDDDDDDDDRETKIVVTLTKSPAGVDYDSIPPEERIPYENEDNQKSLESGSESVIVALQLASLLQTSEGGVDLFLTLDGVALADPKLVLDFPAIYNEDYPSQGGEPGFLQRFLDAGGRAIVCPQCAETRGLDEGEILQEDGVVWGNPGIIGKSFRDADKVLDF